MKKSLVAYYSRRGQNYVSGSLIEFTEGNTEVIAKKIQALTNSDIFEIDTVLKYPKDYMETTRVAKKELNADARPELTGTVDNIDRKSVV